jgi:predicted DNA-binding protein (MmcQ/YjbR family)
MKTFKAYITEQAMVAKTVNELIEDSYNSATKSFSKKI